MDNAQTIEQFNTIVFSVVSKLRQQAKSNVIFSRFAAFAYAGAERSAHIVLVVHSDNQGEVLVGDYGQMALEDIKLFESVYSQNMLIAGITLFDTFLSDITRFLLLVRPKSIPKDYQVRFHDILKESSVASIITNVVEKTVRTRSYESFRKRIKYLRDTFGIDTSSLSSAIDKLERFERLRNSTVHDVSEFRYSADEQPGELKVDPKPHQVTDWGTASKSMVACVEMIQALVTQISKQVFNTEIDESLSDYIDRFLQTLRADLQLEAEFRPQWQ